MHAPRAPDLHVPCLRVASLAVANVTQDEDGRTSTALRGVIQPTCGDCPHPGARAADVAVLYVPTAHLSAGPGE